MSSQSSGTTLSPGGNPPDDRMTTERLYPQVTAYWRVDRSPERDAAIARWEQKLRQHMPEKTPDGVVALPVLPAGSDPRATIVSCSVSTEEHGTGTYGIGVAVAEQSERALADTSERSISAAARAAGGLNAVVSFLGDFLPKGPVTHEVRFTLSTDDFRSLIAPREVTESCSDAQVRVLGRVSRQMAVYEVEGGANGVESFSVSREEDAFEVVAIASGLFRLDTHERVPLGDDVSQLVVTSLFEPIGGRE